MLPNGYPNVPKLLRGTAKFAPKNSDGTFQIPLILSPSSDLSFTMASNSVSYTSAESGIGKILDTTLTDLARSLKLVCNKVDDETRGLFIVGDLSKVTQTSGTVTAEETDYVRVNRSAMLGGGSGVFGISAVTVSSFEGATAASRVNSHAYLVGDVYVPATPNTHWYMVTVAGSSAASPPSFTTNGTSFTDGTATVIDMGLIAYTLTTDYTLDTNLGEVLIPSTGAIAAAVANVPAAVLNLGRTFRLSVDYTRSAQVFNRVSASDVANLEGHFWFTEDNPKKGNGRWYMDSVQMAPSGDFALKSGNNYGAMTFDISIQESAVGADLTLDGIPVALGG